MKREDLQLFKRIYRAINTKGRKRAYISIHASLEWAKGIVRTRSIIGLCLLADIMKEHGEGRPC